MWASVTLTGTTDLTQSTLGPEDLPTYVLNSSMFESSSDFTINGSNFNVIAGGQTVEENLTVQGSQTVHWHQKIQGDQKVIFHCGKYT